MIGHSLSIHQNNKTQSIKRGQGHRLRVQQSIRQQALNTDTFQTISRKMELHLLRQKSILTQEYQEFTTWVIRAL